MNKPFKHLFYCLLLLVAGSFNHAYALASVDARMGGAWFDPTHSGEGFLLEVLEDNRAVIYWFTYDEAGAQRWFFGLGETVNDSAVFNELMVATGAVFGEQFDPGDVIYSDIGELTIQWSDCSTASASYTVDGVKGNQSLKRLSTLAGLDCETPNSTPSPMTGSWFDQTLSRITNPGTPQCEAAPAPNILLIVADDLGLDASSQYELSSEKPITPELDRLADQGLVFENAWIILQSWVLVILPALPVSMSIRSMTVFLLSICIRMNMSLSASSNTLNNQPIRVKNGPYLMVFTN